MIVDPGTTSTPKTFGAPKAPSVAVVVLNWNGWLDTVECVESLLRSDYAHFTIIVCDNDSVDGSLDRLREWASGWLTVDTTSAHDRRWSYLAAPKPIPFLDYDVARDAHSGGERRDAKIVFIQTGGNLGYAGGNNVGIRYARAHTDARYVWILNNDTVVEKHALRRLVDFAMRDHSIGVVGAKLLQHAAPETVQALGGGAIVTSIGMDTQFGRGCSARGTESLPAPLDHIVGASMFVRMDAIAKVGLLEEFYFLYREETDWCIKMRQQNFKLAYCPDAIVWHKEGRSVGFKSELHDYYSVRNMFYLIKCHYPRYLPLVVTYWFFRALAPKVARLQFHRAGCVVRAYRDFFKGVTGKSDAFSHSWPLLEAALRAEEQAVRARSTRQNRAPQRRQP